MSLQRIKHETLAREEHTWIAWFESERKKDLDRKTKEHYYYAQLAYEQRISWVKDPRRYKLEDFLIPFKEGASEAPIKKMDQADYEEAKERAIQYSKARWAAFVGVTKDQMVNNDFEESLEKTRRKNHGNKRRIRKASSPPPRREH